MRIWSWMRGEPSAALRHELQAGARLGLPVGSGTEVFCAAGTVELTALLPWLADRPLTKVLHTGQGWRAGDSTVVNLLARSRASIRVLRHGR